MEQKAFNNIKNIKTSNKSLPERVADQIRDLIINQHLEIGAKIPGEFELADQLNVGRGSVREAVKLLVARNVLEIRRGKGTFIASNIGVIDDPFGLAYMEDEDRLARELFEIRAYLEPWVASLAAVSATAENITELKNWEDEVEKAFGSDKNYLPADQKFHVAISNCTHNRVLPILIPAITYSIHLFGKTNNKTKVPETIETHRKIIAAIEQGDADGAYNAMIEHLLLNIDTVPALADVIPPKK